MLHQHPDPILPGSLFVAPNVDILEDTKKNSLFPDHPDWPTSIDHCMLPFNMRILIKEIKEKPRLMLTLRRSGLIFYEPTVHPPSEAVPLTVHSQQNVIPETNTSNEVVPPSVNNDNANMEGQQANKAAWIPLGA